MGFASSEAKKADLVGKSREKEVIAYLDWCESEVRDSCSLCSATAAQGLRDLEVRELAVAKRLYCEN